MSGEIITQIDQMWYEPALEHLVNREDQIAELKERVRRIRQQRPLTPTLEEWYGGPGLGNTQLTRLLAQLCKEKGVVHAVINFRSLPVQTYLEDPTWLIEEIAAQLIGRETLNNDLLIRLTVLRDTDRPGNMVSAYAQLSRHDLLSRRTEWGDRMKEADASFIVLVRSLGLATKPTDNTPRRDEQPVYNQLVALFFDETDYTLANLLFWLEMWLISPLLASRHCIIVWTARTPWRWRKPDVQRLVSSRSLQPFSLEQSTAQWQNGGVDLATDLFQQVFQLTHGHPAANRVVQEQIRENWPDLPAAPQLFSTQEKKELLQAVFKQVIKQYAFSHLTPEEAAACQRVA